VDSTNRTNSFHMIVVGDGTGGITQDREFQDMFVGELSMKDFI